MSDGIMLVFGEDGVAREYDDTWDITIHCESEEEQKAIWKKLNNLNREVNNLTDTISRQAAIHLIAGYDGVIEQPEQDILSWLLAYHAKSFDLHGRYMPHEVIGWLVHDFANAYMAERREE